MIIKCSEKRGELEFSEKQGLTQASGSEYFRVTIRNYTKMWASSKVYCFDPFNQSLKDFFEDLAKNWKGFDGEKVWTTLEGEFKLICSSDKLGHFAIKSTIRNDLDTLSINTIYIEAGQLDKIAAEVKEFFDIALETN